MDKHFTLDERPWVFSPVCEHEMFTHSAVFRYLQEACLTPGSRPSAGDSPRPRTHTQGSLSGSRYRLAAWVPICVVNVEEHVR